MTLMTLALLACTPEPPPPPPPADAAPAWSLVPQRVQYDGQVFFVEAAVGYEPGVVGGVVQPRTSPVFVGVTLERADGTALDLAVQTRFEGDLQAPFFLSADVGPGVEHVILGVWDHKIEPCQSDRPGCKEFGFLLDGPLASYPPAIYTDPGHRRIRLPPDPFPLRLLGATPAARDAAVKALEEQLAIYEARVDAPPVSADVPADARTVARYGHPGDWAYAEAVAAAISAAIGSPVPVERADGVVGVEVTVRSP